MTPLLGADEVARLLAVSKQRVYALTRAGALPSVRLGRQVRYDAIALEAFLKSGGTWAGGSSSEM